MDIFESRSFMYCHKCGTANDDNNYKCTNCNEIIQAVAVGNSTPSIEDSAGMRILLPVGRSMWAIAAGYLGLFSLIIVPAPIALIVGIIAVIDIKKNPQKHGMGRAIFAIIMGTLFLIPFILMLIGFVGLLFD